jgi:GxxExxY protein
MKEMITKKLVTTMSYEIVGCAIRVHKELGPGLLESVYEKCLIHELKLNGFDVASQIVVPINYKGLELDANLKLDILVNDLIILELKAVENVNPVYDAQIISYMKMLQKPQGLLINFFSNNITKSTKPFVNEFFAALPDL